MLLSGIMRDRPLAEEDLTICRLEVLGRAPVPSLIEVDEVTRGLGVVGSTETFGVTGKLLGPEFVDEVDEKEEFLLFKGCGVYSKLVD